MASRVLDAVMLAKPEIFGTEPFSEFDFRKLSSKKSQSSAVSGGFSARTAELNDQK
ncbi:MAG: hypothetical protein KIT27_05270 [Legionellales bacterium]|nr:hypothetical protein [Legionellales bacterium]